jgi:hypothetical protein
MSVLQIEKMMTAPDQEHTSESDPRAKSQGSWARLIAVIYRIILVLGLLLLGATAVLIFFTRRTYLWVVSVPLGLITLGVILAHVEYRLYQRLHPSQNQEPIVKEK